MGSGALVLVWSHLTCDAQSTSICIHWRWQARPAFSWADRVMQICSALFFCPRNNYGGPEVRRKIHRLRMEIAMKENIKASGGHNFWLACPIHTHNMSISDNFSRSVRCKLPQAVWDDRFARKLPVFWVLRVLLLRDIGFSFFLNEIIIIIN